MAEIDPGFRARRMVLEHQLIRRRMMVQLYKGLAVFALFLMGTFVMEKATGLGPIGALHRVFG